MKIYVGHSRSFNFEEELYKPLRESKLADMAELVFPHEKDKPFFDSRDGLKDMDYMVAECSFPATGLGMELAWANMYTVPIIAVHKQGSSVSDSVKGIANFLIEYSAPGELAEKVIEIVIKQ